MGNDGYEDFLTIKPALTPFGLFWLLLAFATLAAKDLTEVKAVFDRRAIMFAI